MQRKLLLEEAAHDISGACVMGVLEMQTLDEIPLPDTPDAGIPVDVFPALLDNSLLVSRKAPEGAGLAEVKKNSKILELLRDSLGVDHGYDPAAWEKWWKENEGRFRDVP